MQIVRSSIRCLFGAALFLAAGQAAHAQGAAGNAGQGAANSAQLISTNWALGCNPVGKDKKLRCEASKRVALASNRQVLLAVAIAPDLGTKGPPSYVMRLQLPHGIDLPKGVQLQIDKKNQRAPTIRTSSQAGVFARSNLTGPILDAVLKGKIMTVGFTGINGAKLSVPVALDGLAAVFDKLK